MNNVKTKTKVDSKASESIDLKIAWLKSLNEAKDVAEVIELIKKLDDKKANDHE